MASRTDELEAFKALNLTEVAASYGYELDQRASCPTSIKMRHPDGDIIVIGRDPTDRHWTYFAVGENHSGSVIDLVQHRESVSLGVVRKRLRPWLSPTTRPAFTPSETVRDVRPVARDLLAVKAKFDAAQDVAGQHPYLCDTRCLPPPLLTSRRFFGRIRIDERGNVIFPHWTRQNGEAVLCGFEIKNEGYTGFASGGQKGLWPSTVLDEDRRLVIAETAIDALSYAALHDDGVSRYVSIAGQMNPQQPDLLVAAIRRLPRAGVVVMALDHDDAGERLAEQIQEIFGSADRDDLELIDGRPPVADTDWNDVLRASQKSQAASPPPHTGPA